MSILFVNGSPNKKGNTAKLAAKLLAGKEYETLNLVDYKIYAYGQKFEDDQFSEILEKMKEADGILLGSPVYTADISSNMKAILDRAAVVGDMNPGLLKHKVGAAVIVARRGGALNAFDTLNHFFLVQEMIVPGSNYWNMLYGKIPGDVLKDEEGLANMKNLGENIAYVLKKIKKQ